MNSLRKKILIVLPTYNEENILKENALKVYNFCREKIFEYDWQILIADNGSTDKTVTIAQELNQKIPQIIYFHLEKAGRGRALKKAWSEYEADIYVYMDIDLATDLKYLEFLIKAVDKEGCDLATGSRLKRGAEVERSIGREISSRIYNLILKIFFPSYSIKDSQCGFKAISQKIKEQILPKVKNSGWFFDTELLIYSFYRGYRIKEIPVNWKEERFVKRKSTVKFFQTVLDCLKEIIKLKINLIKNSLDYRII